MPKMYRVEDGPSATPTDIPEHLAEEYYRSANWVFHKNAKVPVDYGNGTYGEEKESNFWKILRDGGSYDTLAQRVLRREAKDFKGKNLETFAYGIGHGVGGGWFDGLANRAMDLPESYLEKLEKHNPYMHGAGMMLGFGGMAYATRGKNIRTGAGGAGLLKGGARFTPGGLLQGGAMLTPGGLAFKSGAMVEGLIAKKLGLKVSKEALEGLSTSGKLLRMGAAAGLGGALENVVFEGHSKLGEAFWGDADLTSQQIGADLGFAALVGGGLSGALGLTGGSIGRGLGWAYDSAGKPLSDSAIKLWAKWLSGRGGKEGAEQNLKDLTETLLDPTLRGQVQGVGVAVNKAAKETEGFLNDIGSKAQKIVDFSQSRTKEGDLAEKVTGDNIMESISAAEEQINHMRAMAREIIADPDASTATGHKINELADELEEQILVLWRNTDAAAGIEITAFEVSGGGVGDEFIGDPQMRFGFEVSRQGPKRKLAKGAAEALKDDRGFAEAQGESVVGLRNKRDAAEEASEALGAAWEDGIRDMDRLEGEIAALKKTKPNKRGDRNKKKRQLKKLENSLNERTKETNSIYEKWAKDKEALESLNETLGRQSSDAFERSGRVREREASRDVFESGVRTPEESRLLDEQLRLNQIKSTSFISRLYFRMDNIKKSLGQLLKEGEFPREEGISVGEKEARRVAGERLTEQYQVLQRLLEEPQPWGEMGDIQKEWNFAASEWLDIRDVTRELLKPLKKGDLLKPATKDRPFDYSALREFIDQLRKGEAGDAVSLFDEYIEKTERLIRMAEKHFGPRMKAEGVHIDIKEMKAGAQRMKDALEEIRKLQNTQEMLQERFPEAREMIKGIKRTARTIGWVGAGSGALDVSTVALAETANLLSTAVNRPLWALKRFAQISDLKRRVSNTIDKAARKTAKRMAQQGGDGTIKGAYRARTGVRGGKVRGAINMLKTIGIHEHLRDPHRKSVIADDTQQVIEILDGLNSSSPLLRSKIEESVNHLDGAPETQEALRQHVYGSLYYLLNNLPLGISRTVDAFTGETKYAITDSAAREFMDVFTVLIDPMVVPEKMAEGGLTVAESKAFRDQFPKLWEQFKVGVFENIAGKDIPFSAKMQLSILFGEALTPMANPAMVNLLQQQYAPDPEGQKRKPSRAKLKAIGERADQMMTPSQKAFAT